MPDKMLKFTDIDQQSPTKREVSIRKDDFSEIYAEYIHEKAVEQSSRSVSYTHLTLPTILLV